MDNEQYICINLLKDLFNYGGEITSKDALITLGGELIPAEYKPNGVLTRNSLYQYFTANITRGIDKDILDAYLTNLLNRTYIDVLLTEDLPDLSDGKLCYKNDMTLQCISWEIIRECILIQALLGNEFCIGFHKQGQDDIIVTFKAESVQEQNIVYIYFNDIAAKVYRKYKHGNFSKMFSPRTYRW